MITKRKKLKMIYEYCEKYYDKKITDKNFKGLGRVGLQHICELCDKPRFRKHLLMRLLEKYENTTSIENKYEKLQKDVKFCLHSIKQETEMSTDERTRTEMKTCYEILRRCINE